jgi:sugar phosphate isomerase/epimerase
MRLGYLTASVPADLDKVADGLDQYGLSAVWAALEGRTEDECVALGEKARSLGIVLGETAMWGNLMTDDAAKRSERIEKCRALLRKAELAGCRCVVTLVGTKDPSDHGLAPHPYMYTDAAKREFREICLRILDGLEFNVCRYGIEPWHNTFFYQPEDIRAFLDSVGHPALALHLDQMNMVSQRSFYNTTGLINTTFDLLADEVA